MIVAGWENESTDPVLMSRIIADSLLSEFRRSRGAQRLGVLNLMRLLEMYQSDAFFPNMSIGIMDEDDSLNDDFVVQMKSLDRLKTAIASTHREISPDLTAHLFVTRVASILKRLLGPDLIDPEGAAEAERFLSVLTRSLASV